MKIVTLCCFIILFQAVTLFSFGFNLKSFTENRNFQLRIHSNSDIIRPFETNEKINDDKLVRKYISSYLLLISHFLYLRNIFMVQINVY